MGATTRPIALRLKFRAGEHVVTEHSHKFRIASLRRELADVGLQVAQVVTDSLERFAVVLTRPSGTQKR